MRTRSATSLLSAGGALPTSEPWTTLGPRRIGRGSLGEILLVCLLASGTALFAASDSLKSAYELHDARLAFDTAVAVVATFVCVLTSVRFMVEGRTLDLLLAAGFWSIALGTVAFGLVPVFGGGSLAPTAAWQLVGARLLGAGLIAIAPYADGRMAARRRSLLSVGVGVVVVLAVAAGAMNVSISSCPARRRHGRGRVRAPRRGAAHEPLARRSRRLRAPLSALRTGSRQLDVPRGDARGLRGSSSRAHARRLERSACCRATSFAWSPTASCS